jgi:hypothetical protein
VDVGFEVDVGLRGRHPGTTWFHVDRSQVDGGNLHVVEFLILPGRIFLE